MQCLFKYSSIFFGGLVKIQISLIKYQPRCSESPIPLLLVVCLITWAMISSNSSGYLLQAFSTFIAASSLLILSFGKSPINIIIFVNVSIASSLSFSMHICIVKGPLTTCLENFTNSTVVWLPQSVVDFVLALLRVPVLLFAVSCLKKYLIA
eukprot:NODE_100_length_20777_cov_0.240884.p14 type:complete len:152 gc:universal NODE_100_length_20777_cov_0.240884:4372-4827(+)